MLIVHKYKCTIGTKSLISTNCITCVPVVPDTDTNGTTNILS